MAGRRKPDWLRVARWACMALIAAAAPVAMFGRGYVPDAVVAGGVVGLIAGMIALVCLEGKRREAVAREQQQAPMVTEIATIVSRRVAHSYTGGRGRFTSHDSWCITFRTAKHGDVELTVDWDTWKRFPDGTRGELRYKGAYFIRFIGR